MPCSTPIRLTALAVMLLALTFATFRAAKGQRKSITAGFETQVVLSEITVPVEIIETGEDPAVREIRVRP